jgi:putative oligomerization/nucleic acid binding protein
MAGEVQEVPYNLKQAVIAATGIYAIVCIFELLGQGSAYGLIPGVLAGLSYWLVYGKLTTDVSTARYAAIGLAGVSVVDMVLTFWIFSSPGATNQAAVFVGFANVGAIACLGYAAWQLQQMAKSGLASPAARSPAAASSSPGHTTGSAGSDAVEQLKRLAELHKAGVLSDSEFEAKKAELLKRI